MSILGFSFSSCSCSSSYLNYPHLPNLEIPSKSFTSLSNSKILLSNSKISNFKATQFPKIISFTNAVHSRFKCSATASQLTKGSDESLEAKRVEDKSVSVILLAGGKGTRMGASMPKQYLPLLGQPIALYSFYTFSLMPEVREIIVVCDPSYRDIFEDAKEKIQVNLKFALPGKERQDSVYSGFQVSDNYSVLDRLDILLYLSITGNGTWFFFLVILCRKSSDRIDFLQAADSNSTLLCIHDSARPLVSSIDTKKVLIDGWLIGAAVLGVHAKATIKEANTASFVVKTLDRKTLWEMQTPQVIKPEILKMGFELVNREGLEVTDDVSIVEHLKLPVYITEGSYTNIKVTTPDDLLLAERILNATSS